MVGFLAIIQVINLHYSNIHHRISLNINQNLTRTLYTLHPSSPLCNNHFYTTPQPSLFYHLLSSAQFQCFDILVLFSHNVSFFLLHISFPWQLIIVEQTSLGFSSATNLRRGESTKQVSLHGLVQHTYICLSLKSG